MQAVAPHAQANVVNIPAPTAQPTGGPVAPPQAPVVPAGGAPDPMPPPPPGSAQGSMIDFDNMSAGGSSTTSVPSVQANGPHQWVPNGGFHLLDLTSLTDTVAYEMWKNTIGFFHLSRCMDELIMLITYQLLGSTTTLGSCPWSMKCFDTQIGYTMMRLAMAFPHAMPTEWAEKTRKTCFLSRLHPNLKSALAWEMCLDGGGHQMTYEEKDLWGTRHCDLWTPHELVWVDCLAQQQLWGHVRWGHSDEGVVHHQAGPQRTHEALQYPDWLHNDEAGHGLSTCHACRVSRGNQEDLLPEWAVPQP